MLCITTKALLTALLGVTLAAPALAATDFYVVVPVKERTAPAAAPSIEVTLNPVSLPVGWVGQPYAGFDLKTALSVTGDAHFAPAGVQWSVLAGALPAGLSLNADGTLTGTPAATGTGTFSVRASYKGHNGQQT